MLERLHKVSDRFTHYLVLVVAVLIIASIIIVAFPQQKADAAGLPFGGKLLFFSPPIITAYVNCPALTAIYNYPTGTVMYLMLPPSVPSAFFNYYTPGVAVLGSYIPVPIIINCPFAPIFPAFYYGTSLVPTP